MANDLQIAGVKLPTVVVGACPTTVFVDVINAGTDPASFPAPMTVCLDIRTSMEGRPVDHYSVSTPVESPAILPGKIRTFTFTGVQFPCANSAIVTATADCSGSVPNNARTSPELVVIVPKIDAVPWLWTDIRLGLQDSTGQISWAPGALCPGATCVAEVSVRNAGCAAAPPSVTTLEILDGAGSPVASMKLNTPAISAGGTTVLKFSTVLPTTAAGQSLKFRACADSTGVVVPQCDLVHACAERTLPLTTASAPKLTFFAKAPIFPGEPAALSWRIQNVCSDLGKVTATISYQGTGLYTSVQIPVGLQDAEKGEDRDVAPTPAVAANFYKIGTSKLTLEITGTGTDPGPYTATTLVSVIAEPVPGTWAFTAPAAGTTGASPWRRAYNVSGRLTNPARATMTPSSVVLDETSTIQAPAALVASPPLGAIVPGVFGTAIWVFIQTWTWLTPGIWFIVGPFSGTFAYAVTFAMQDAFGNAYPARTSSGTIVVVSVSGLKVGFAGAAYTFFCIAFGLFVAGLAAVAGVVTAVGAPALFAAAGVAFGIAGGLGLAALDPPVPNFDYQRVESVRRPELPPEVSEHPALAPILPVFALVARIAAASAALSGTEARLIAARIDRDRGAIDLQSTEYRDLRDSLLTAARQVPFAVLEAIDGVRAEPLLRPATDGRSLQRTITAWSRKGVDAKARRAWNASGIAAQYLRDVELALTTPGYVVRSFDVALAELTQAVAQIASGIEAESELVLHPPTAGTQPQGRGEETPEP